MKRQVLAVDLGASSGRVMLGEFADGKIRIKELHRFANEPITELGCLRWNFPQLLNEVKKGIKKAGKYGTIDSISVDTWGVDFGLLDKAGNLIENPVHYRDKRTSGVMNRVLQIISKEELYQITGNQIMEINTVFQLCALSACHPELLAQSENLLLMPDLFLYYLSGKKCSEYSIASTTQMMNCKQRIWSDEIAKRLQLPKEIFPSIIPAGTRIGFIKKELQQELNVGKITVIAGAGHDTQCAMAAVPASEENFIFISSGTWSLFGTEQSQPCINETAKERNLTNEWGAFEKVSFLKNIAGTWLIQESRNQWKREGEPLSYQELEELAERAAPFTCLIDPDAADFSAPGNMPAQIRGFAERTHQQIPQTKGAVIRCINESLALKYRKALEELQDCTGKKYDTIYLVGGGSQSKQLCQMTANACNCTVYAGPVEASVLGNIGIQLIALGELHNLSEFRRIVAKSTEMKLYHPQKTELWQRIGQSAKQIFDRENAEWN